MNAKLKAYKKLNGVFPMQLRYFFYKGVRIVRGDFNNIKNR